MLGKKKKQDEQPAEDTSSQNIDRPQTLEELDRMAREKRDNESKEQTDETAGTIEHEVVHNDEQTADTNVRKVTPPQTRLYVLVGAAVMIMVFGVAMFYSTIEDGSIGVGLGGNGAVVPDSEQGSSNLLPEGRYVYAANIGDATYERYNLDSESREDIETGGSLSNGGFSPAFQLSRNSLASAARTGQGFVLKNTDQTHTVLAEQVSSVSEWVLIPDGTKMYALVGSSLHSYDTFSGEGGEVASNFVPAGAELSNLTYTRSGQIILFAKTDTIVRSATYDQQSGEVTTAEVTVQRLGLVGDFLRNSVSPDGLTITWPAVVNGNQTMLLLSLNSLVLRPIYLPEAGNSVIDFAWSEDSNNIFIYESGARPLLANLKVGTFEKEILLENVASAAALDWSPDKQYVSYISGGTLRAISLETKEVIDLIQPVSANTVTGWFSN